MERPNNHELDPQVQHTIQRIVTHQDSIALRLITFPPGQHVIAKNDKGIPIVVYKDDSFSAIKAITDPFTKIGAGGVVIEHVGYQLYHDMQPYTAISISSHTDKPTEDKVKSMIEEGVLKPGEIATFYMFRNREESLKKVVLPYGIDPLKRDKDIKANKDSLVSVPGVIELEEIEQVEMIAYGLKTVLDDYFRLNN